jgi:hypothetical protein
MLMQSGPWSEPPLSTTNSSLALQCIAVAFSIRFLPTRRVSQGRMYRVLELWMPPVCGFARAGGRAGICWFGNAAAASPIHSTDWASSEAAGRQTAAIPHIHAEQLRVHCSVRLSGLSENFQNGQVAAYTLACVCARPSV